MPSILVRPRNSATFAGVALLVVVVVVALVGPLFLPAPGSIDYHLLRATSPSSHHLLGTDEIGRDTLSRVLAGTRLALATGALGAVIWTVLALVLGMVLSTAQRRKRGRLVATGLMLIAICVIALALAWNPVLRMKLFLGGIDGFDYVVAGFMLLIIGGVRICRLILMDDAPIERPVRQIMSLASSVIPEACIVLLIAALAPSRLAYLGQGYLDHPPIPRLADMLIEIRDLFTILNYPWLVWPPMIMVLVIATALALIAIGTGQRQGQASSASSLP